MSGTIEGHLQIMAPVTPPPPPPPSKYAVLYENLLIQAMRVGVLIAVCVVWQLATTYGLVDPFLLSTPGDVLSFLGSAITSGDIWPDVRATVVPTAIAFVIGSATGVLTGLVLAVSPRLNAVLDPYLTIANAMPRVALAPLFLMWFGLGETTKVMMGISTVYFILVLNTFAAVRSIEPDLRTICDVMGANRVQTLIKLTLPAAVPSIFAGLKLAIVYALLGVVLAEMLASQSGLGQLLQYYSGKFEVAGVFGVLILLALLAVIGTTIVGLVEKRILRWR